MFLTWYCEETNLMKSLLQETFFSGAYKFNRIEVHFCIFVFIYLILGYGLV